MRSTGSPVPQIDLISPLIFDGTFSLCIVQANTTLSVVASRTNADSASISLGTLVQWLSASRPWSPPLLTGPVAGRRLLATRRRATARQIASNS